MSNLFPILDERETPYYTIQERLLVMVHLLAITTQRQLSTITGWEQSKVRDAINRLRNQGKTEEEKDQWVQYWQLPGRQFAYTLGEKGLEIAVSIRKESMGQGKKKKRPHKRGQVAHFLGFNEILCRLIHGGLDVQEWMVGKEVMSFLFSQFKTRTIEGSEVHVKLPDYLPFRPDGVVQLQEKKPYFIEYDTGSESIAKLMQRMENYLENYWRLVDAKEIPIDYPVLWVTVSERRKQKIEEVGKLAFSQFQNMYNRPFIPTMYAAVEGEEVAFLAGKRSIDPFMSDEM